MKVTVFGISLLLCCLLHGQTSDTVNIKSDKYILTLWGESYYRYEDPITLINTCGYLNPIDSFFYSCLQKAIIRINSNNQAQLMEGAGCCHGMEDDIPVNLHTGNSTFYAAIRRFRYSKGLLIIRKKNVAKIEVIINDLVEKDRIKELKTGVEYLFNLSYKFVNP